MAKVTDQSIPSGLEELYAKLLGFTSQTTDVYVRKTNSAVSVLRRQLLISISLFNRWGSLYDSFTSLRKTAWQNYWATLPFGSHLGLNGYPGSGFSAFVYVNAPRIKANLDLLLDPPFGPNLLFNPTFLTSADGWTVVPASYNIQYLEPGVRFYETGENEDAASLTGTTIFTLTEAGTYRYSIDVSSDGDGDADNNLTISLNDSVTQFFTHTFDLNPNKGTGVHTYYIDVVIDIGSVPDEVTPIITGFGIISAGEVVFNNIQLRKIA